MKILIEDLGAAPLIAEYDAEQRIIRVNARVVERMRVRRGEEAAHALVTCAIAHESRHAACPGAGEEDAHAYASMTTGYDPRALEASLR